MTNRSSRGSDKTAVPQALRARQTDWDPIRGFHQGQRPQVPRQQAGHMTAPDRSGITDFSLAPTGPSTHEALRAQPALGPGASKSDLGRDPDDVGSDDLSVRCHPKGLFAAAG